MDGCFSGDPVTDGRVWTRLAERMVGGGVELGYDPNELAHIYFNEETGQFETPIAGGPSQDRVENLLKAIVFKEIYEPAISGFSGPIRPEVGIKTLDDSLLMKATSCGSRRAVRSSLMARS